ncbi:hypothetical protein JCM31826_01270 [Thermaurantimonas aggregans]|uniref:Uncharacterized protein n=1 Tax=Thermaurantimonas aggregans TaxID=2173829 RepID=A0A401XI07_9FLAO|nr:hypothetical protein [Thermaurantimonas aggregans]MCX8149203.1 hypothetical protein [Thermaurantimonas aggregans]GCD76645.1 hypothetical protein JCM31826_01270 [Thermaurantimonas aggregans]
MKKLIYLLVLPIYVTSQPSLTEVFLPQYIQGINGTNNNRVPFVYRVTIDGLTPNATYRYFNQVVTSSDGATTNGAGNVIFYSNTGYAFTSKTKFNKFRNVLNKKLM